jgi:hypothetical protein
MAGMSLARSDQRRDVVRPILAVAVHDHDGVDVVAAGDLRQPDGDRPLVPEIEREVNDLDIDDAGFGRQLDPIEIEGLEGAVIDGDDVTRDVGAGQLPGKLGNQLGERVPIVQHRQDHGNPRRHLENPGQFTRKNAEVFRSSLE